MRFAWLSALVLLAGCGGGSPPQSITIPDLTSYLVMSRCPNGQPAVLNPGCSGAKPQQAADPMVVRRADWARPETGQIEDTFITVDGARYVTTFSYRPNREFVAANGDGGDVYVIDGKGARIDFTQNGTSNGGTIWGYWVGAKCGGDGWFAFDKYTPTGTWASKVALLNGSTDPNACPSMNKAYTRWRSEAASVPFQVNGVRISDISLPVVVSEHYGGASMAASTMERIVMAKGYGRVLWEAWSRTPNGFTTACPGVMPWSSPPASGWYLNDRRCLTNVVSDDGSLTGTRYGWPP